MPVFFRFFAGLCLVCLACPVADAGAPDVAAFCAETGAPTSPLHDKALAHWKRMYEKERPNHVATARWLLYGNIPEKRLTETAALLDKTHAVAVKALELAGAEPWTGKLAVFVVDDRGELTTLVRLIQKRRAEPDEQGAFGIEGDFPHILAGPPVSKVGLRPDVHAAEQMATALLYGKKGGPGVALWVREAFGRASALKAGPAAALLAEQRRTTTYVTKGKRNLKDVLGRGVLENDEAIVLRGSLLQYLAYSGRTTKFLPFIAGFQPTETVAEPTVEQALVAAGLPLDRLEPFWQVWLKK